MSALDRFAITVSKCEEVVADLQRTLAAAPTPKSLRKAARLVGMSRLVVGGMVKVRCHTMLRCHAQAGTWPQYSALRVVLHSPPPLLAVAAGS